MRSSRTGLFSLCWSGLPTQGTATSSVRRAVLAEDGISQGKTTWCRPTGSQLSAVLVISSALIGARQRPGEPSLASCHRTAATKN